MKSTTLFFLIIFWGIFGFTQSSRILVNPDGTHSIIPDEEDSGVIINPDGSHSVLINNGCTSTIINSDGSHSIIHKNGILAFQISPGEPNSTDDCNEDSFTQIDPNSIHPFVNPYVRTAIRSKKKGYKKIVIQDKNSAVKRVFYIEKSKFRKKKKELRHRKKIEAKN